MDLTQDIQQQNMSSQIFEPEDPPARMLVVKLRILNMATFTHPQTTDFPDPIVAASLADLELDEQAALIKAQERVDQRVKITAEHHVKKLRIIESLHQRIFFVKDEHDFPIKIQIPSVPDLHAQVGFRNLICASNWAAVPQHMSVKGIDWPPKSADQLLRADEHEDCLGCLMKEHRREDILAAEYGGRLQQNDSVQLRTGIGMVSGSVIRTNQTFGTVVVAINPDGQALEVTWEALVVPRPLEEPPTTTLITSPQLPCNCEIENWRKHQGKWYKNFELRKTSPVSVGLFATAYIPAGRPIGEFVGIFIPDSSYYSALPGFSPSARSSAAVMNYRLDISIGRKPAAEADEQGITCFIDNFVYGNFTRFVKHSCTPNAGRSEYRFGWVRMNVLFSRRPIMAGEEVTEDFGLLYLKEMGGCGCGSERCQIKQRQDSR